MLEHDRFDGPIADLSGIFGSVAAAILRLLTGVSTGEIPAADAERQTDTLTTTLMAAAAEWVNMHVPEMYAEGVREGGGDPENLSAPQTVYSDTMRSDVMEDIAIGIRSLNDDSRRTLRELAKFALESNLRGDSLYRQANSMASFMEGLDIKIVDRGGRRWDARAYSAMVLRTKAAEIGNAGTLNTAQELGIGTVHVFDGGPGDTDKPCMDANGQVWTTAYAMLHKTEHPNCRRSFSPTTSDYDGPVHRGEGATREPDEPILPPGEFRNARDAERWLRDEYPHMQYVDLTGMDTRLANESFKQYKKLTDEYPDVSERITRIVTDDPPEGKNWLAWANSNGTLAFDRKSYSDYDKLAHSMRRAEAAGFHPKRCPGVETVVTHEFGHHVDYWLSSLTDTSVLPYVRSDGAGLIADTIRMFRATNWKDGKRVSRYARVNDREGWAEGFVALNHDPQGNRLKYVKNQRKLLEALKKENHRAKGDYEWAFEIPDRDRRSSVMHDVFEWGEKFNLHAI